MGTERSCIRGFGAQHPFSIPDHRAVLNKLLLLGRYTKGRSHVVLFHKTTLDWSTLYIDLESKYTYSPELIQYYIMSIEGTVIGSLLDVNSKKMVLTDTNLHIEDREETGRYECNNEKGHGGITVYDDSEGSFLIIPSEPVINEFVVEVNA